MLSFSYTKQKDRSKEKFIEVMEDYKLQRKDSFTKLRADVCIVLAVWLNKYRNKHNKYSESSDAVTFTTKS